MKKRSSILLCLVIALIALSIGYLIPSSTDQDGRDQEIQASRSSRVSEGRDSKKHEMKRLRRALARANGSDHWLHWIARAENASLDEFPQLLALAKGNENAFGLIAAEWKRRDFDHLLQTLGEIDQLKAEDDSLRNFPSFDLVEFLDPWVRNNLQEAISRLDSMELTREISDLKGRAIFMLARQDFHAALDLMSRWNVRDVHFGTEFVEKMAAQNPRALAERFFDYQVQQMKLHPKGADYITWIHLRQIAEVWAQINPEAAMAYSRDDLPSREFMRFRERAFLEWGKRDFQASANWLGKQNDEALEDQLRPALLKVWAGVDAPAALAWCHDHLEGKHLEAAVVQVTQGVIDTDASQAAEFVKQMPASIAQRKAAVLVADRLFHHMLADPFRNDSDTLKPMSAEKLAWINSFDRETIGAIIGRMGASWANLNLDEVLTFLSEGKGSEITPHVYGVVSRPLVARDGVEAFKWAENFEGEKVGIITKQLFGEYLKRDTSQAMTWFEALPQQDTRRDPVVKEIVRVVAADPGQQGLLKHLLPSDRDTVMITLQFQIRSQAQRDLLMKVFEGQ